MADATNPFLVEMGRRIRRRRDDWQLTGAEVAEAIRMSPSQFSTLERGGQSLIRPEQFARLAAVLHTTTDYLLQLSEERGDIPAMPCRGEQVPVNGWPVLPPAVPRGRGPLRQSVTDSESTMLHDFVRFFRRVPSCSTRMADEQRWWHDAGPM